MSKNGNGPFKQLHAKSKVLPIYSCPEAGEYCPVKLIDLNFSKLPPKALENDLEKVLSLPWCTTTPVGKHTLIADDVYVRHNFLTLKCG